MNFTLKKSDLNFKVYTVASKPTTPGAENDIAVISSVHMTNWLMSPAKPSGVPRNDGDVWIQYSTQGNTFNALKNNSMMIATISAWQYVNDAWTSVKVVSCQGGEWVTYLFNVGNQCVGITGGWTSDGYTYGSYTIVPPTIGDTLKVSAAIASGSNRACVAGTVDKVDLTNIHTISISVDEVIGICNLCVSESKNAYSGAVVLERINDVGTTDIKLPSSLNGTYYIAVAAETSSSEKTCSLDAVSMWFK